MKPPVYKTKRFCLKPYQRGDENRFVEIGTDTEVIKFMGDSSLDSETLRKQEMALFEKILDVYKKTESRLFWIWGIFEEKKLVGHFELKETENTKENELEIVYMVHPDERKKGVMSEILAFFKRNQKLFNKKIIATVDFENSESISLLEKWGIKKKEVIYDDEGKFYKIHLIQ